MKAYEAPEINIPSNYQKHRMKLQKSKENIE
jgi:hypothetical protein